MRNFQGQYGCLVFVVLIISLSGDQAEALTSSYGIKSLNRSSFPPGFVFGSASSAYQVEGAANEDGKGPSVWDSFTQKYPEKIKDHSNGNVATDSYHLYKEDVKMVKNMRLNAYRFSISWPRVIPHGKVSRGVNQQGLRYYRNLINELLKNGIEPFVTLFHWDTPQALEDEYGGFLSSQIVNHYRDYTNLCFQTFGNQVKNWITFNEPSTYSINGYVSGVFAPGRCSSWLNPNCTDGDSGVEPYTVAHNQLLAHAAAVKLYRDNYQASQKGKIGITLESRWMVPYSDEPINRNATIRALHFSLGWFMAPLTSGNYPHTMRSLAGSRLPKFSKEEANMLKGSFDFIGLNYYTANYVQHFSYSNAVNTSYTTDSQTRTRISLLLWQYQPQSAWCIFGYSAFGACRMFNAFKLLNILENIVRQQAAYINAQVERDGVPIGPKGASSWLYIYPRGIRDLLVYVKRNYNNPTIYITENGVDELNNSTLPLQETLNDTKRVDYYFQHISFVQRAIREGVNVKGYFAWALIDNFEWNAGYTSRFGLNFVDYSNGLKRYKKLSARWFKNFLKA